MEEGILKEFVFKIINLWLFNFFVIRYLVIQNFLCELNKLVHILREYEQASVLRHTTWLTHFKSVLNMRKYNSSKVRNKLIPCLLI